LIFYIHIDIYIQYIQTTRDDYRVARHSLPTQRLHTHMQSKLCRACRLLARSRMTLKSLSTLAKILCTVLAKELGIQVAVVKRSLSRGHLCAFVSGQGCVFVCVCVCVSVSVCVCIYVCLCLCLFTLIRAGLYAFVRARSHLQVLRRKHVCPLVSRHKTWVGTDLKTPSIVMSLLEKNPILVGYF